MSSLGRALRRHVVRKRNLSWKEWEKRAKQRNGIGAHPTERGYFIF